MSTEVIDISKRDRTIYILIRQHVSISSIAKRFGLSETRVRRIYAEQRSKIVNGDFDIPEIDKMCRILGVREQDRGKLQSILQKHGFTNEDEVWVYTDISEFESIPSIGKAFGAIIWLAQHMRIE